MLADLVVLDRDPFDGPPQEIHGARVAATFVGGQRVFQALRGPSSFAGDAGNMPAGGSCPAYAYAGKRERGR